MGLTRQPLTPQQSYSPEIEPASDFTAFTGSPLTQSLASLQSALGNAGMLAWLNETAQAPLSSTPPPAGPAINDEDEDEGPHPAYQPPPQRAGGDHPVGAPVRPLRRAGPG